MGTLMMTVKEMFSVITELDPMLNATRVAVLFGKKTWKYKGKGCLCFNFWCKLLAALHLSYITITLQNSLTLKH